MQHQQATSFCAQTAILGPDGAMLKECRGLDQNYSYTVQANLCQKLLFLHQLTHNMTTDCSLDYKFSTCKLHAQNMFI